jgi:hypothetical protein
MLISASQQGRISKPAAYSPGIKRCCWRLLGGAPSGAHSGLAAGRMDKEQRSKPVRQAKVRRHTGLCRRPTASGNRGHGHFLLHLPLLHRRQSVALATGEGGGGVELGKPVEEEGHGGEKGSVGDQARTARRSLSRGCRRGEDAERRKELWITVCAFPVGEWSVIQSRHHHGIGSTKKPILPRQDRAEDHWGGTEKIPDSRFKLFGRRSEASVARGRTASHRRPGVRLRACSSALVGLAGLAGTSCLPRYLVSPEGTPSSAVPAPPRHAWATRANDSAARIWGSVPCRRRCTQSCGGH